MSTSLLYQIALTLIPGIGCVQARALLEYFQPEEIFRAPKKQLEKIAGLGAVRVNNIRAFKGFDVVEREIAFIEKYKIQPLFINDAGYPQRLLNCYDAPVMLYYRGNRDLNHSKIISIVGSRIHTDYGKQMTEALVEGLAAEDVLIVSGLAYGIDAIAHKASLRNKISTVGVLAHGLDKIYPAGHADMAKDMISNGGVLTEFVTGSKPDKHHFPSRNRIVAGMSDATIVVETDIKGGSIITADLANGYHKDVFAIPGKIGDKKSAGCNYLIKTNKAMLLTDARQLLETMGWIQVGKPSRAKSRELFVNLTTEERAIINLLAEKELVSIDDINFYSGLSSSTIAVSMLNLEMQQIIQCLPGKMYRII